MSPELFFAACAVVVVLIVWLGVSRYRRGKALASMREACRAHKDRADAIDADRQSVAAELVKAQDETQEARRERNSAREERDEALTEVAHLKSGNLDRDNQIAKIQSHAETLESFCDGYKKEIRELKEAAEQHAARPVLAVTTKASQRGRVRVQIRENDDTVLLQSPAGYGSQEKADAIVERICGSRLEKAE